ncbi:MAG TPA: hypothetical protein VF395_07180 [Polyangiaceae bacterium]
MKIRHLAIVPALFLMVACGGSSTPEPETPAAEAAGATEAKPAGEAKPADDAKPAADAPAAEEKK